MLSSWVYSSMYSNLRATWPHWPKTESPVESLKYKAQRRPLSYRTVRQQGSKASIPTPLGLLPEPLPRPTHDL